ncbi:MAG: hypothetical protein IKM61_00390 [Eubacteriaceae bacterium]|nr:hypothetical protein [Eubacteriaceae bacterium]
MKTFKKIVAFTLAAVMVAAVSVGATVAYLQDEDSDVNVMTLGNVQIEQHEYERVVDADGKWVSTGETDKYGYTPDKIKEFSQAKPLYPAVFADGAIKWDDRVADHQQSWEQIEAPGSVYLFDDSVKNVQDKFVFVKNTGKSDAYVRTWIALEQGSIEADNFKNVIMTNTDGVHWSWEVSETDVEIKDDKDVANTYYIICATYLGPKSNPTGILAPETTTYPSLLQVYMKPEAENEDVEAIDGNKNGTYDILVFSQAVQTEGFADAKTALNTAFGTEHPWQGEDVPHIPTLEELAKDTWDGTVDTSWYNDTDAEFTITTAEQLAGFAKLVDDGNTFEGKTIKLGKNIDLYAEDENGEAISFNPIGSYRNDTAFKGTFDGQEFTISNLSQNTWALNNGYYYSDLGLGLFGLVEDATIKDLVMDGASISGESGMCGTVAAAAYGECTFENITVSDSKVNDYQYYAGGIVGWASGDHQYINCDIEASTIIGGQWGDFGNANGGVIGGCGSSAKILIKDCTIACRIDAVNDIVSAYQWYNYRNSGMIIGRVPQSITNGEVQTVKTPENVTCENVTVIYGDWANYTYCEFAGTGYPYVRVQAGVSVDAYSNVRYGHPTDANGNTVVDDNHIHNDGEAHHELIVFDQLFGGPADHRYCYYGISAFDGVNVIYNNK